MHVLIRASGCTPTLSVRLFGCRHCHSLLQHEPLVIYPGCLESALCVKFVRLCNMMSTRHGYAGFYLMDDASGTAATAAHAARLLSQTGAS